MKKALLLKSTSLLVVLFAVVALFFTSANTENKADKQAIAALSAEVAKMKSELGTLKNGTETFDEALFLGEIAMFAGNFAPRGWSFCEGQLLPIANYNALFSLLGTTYGGDGRTTFGLPDLRGRVPVHQGSGPGLTKIRLGQKGGLESIAPNTVNVTGAGEVSVVSGIPGRTYDNRQPYLGINYIIATNTGAYPPRN